MRTCCVKSQIKPPFSWLIGKNKLQTHHKTDVYLAPPNSKVHTALGISCCYNKPSYEPVTKELLNKPTRPPDTNLIIFSCRFLSKYRYILLKKSASQDENLNRSANYFHHLLSVSLTDDGITVCSNLFKKRSDSRFPDPEGR